MAVPIPDDASFETLLNAWQSATADFIDLVTPLSQEEWDAPTALPGWSVGDIVAHVSWIESVLIGEYDEPHEPDWGALPHAVSFFQRATEVPVDLRRSWPREAVLIELADITNRRRSALEAGPHDLTLEVDGPLGPAPLGRVIRMRTMDTWVHEQDIRAALGRPGHLDTLGAQAAAAQLLPGLMKIWAKSAGAAPGEVLHVRMTGPGVEASVVVVVGDDGRARIAADDLVDQGGPATATLTMSWPTYLDLACGRGDLQALRASVQCEGNPALATQVLDNFTVMI